MGQACGAPGVTVSDFVVSCVPSEYWIWSAMIRPARTFTVVAISVRSVTASLTSLTVTLLPGTTMAEYSPGSRVPSSVANVTPTTASLGNGLNNVSS